MWKRPTTPAPKPTTQTFPGNNRTPAPKPTASNPEPVWLAAHPKSASELLNLQSLYGNMGTERMLQSLEPVSKTEPVIQGKWIEEKQYFKRQGYKEGHVNVESWDKDIGGKIWYRYKPDYIWFYSYNIVDSDGDDPHENQWFTEGEWAQLMKPIPGCLIEQPKPEEPITVSDECQRFIQSIQQIFSASCPRLLANSRWTIEDFREGIQALNNKGICNILTAGWLLQWLQPNSPSDMGFGFETFKSMSLLKKLFDETNKEKKSSWGDQSYKVTFAFMEYASKSGKTRGWLDDFQNSTQVNLDLEYQKFLQFIGTWQDTHHNLQSLEGNVADIRQADVQGFLEKALQPIIEGGQPFQGLIVITPGRGGNLLKDGHELAFRSLDGVKAQYYDQSSGPSPEVFLTKFIGYFSEYLYAAYVENPFKISGILTDMIKFEIII